MEYRIPIDDLKRYSFKFSCLISLTALVSTLIIETEISVVIYRAVMAFIHFYGCFIINIFLYAKLSKHQKEFNERVKLLYGIGLTMLFVTLTTAVSQFFIAQKLLPQSLNDQRLNEVLNSRLVFFFIPFISTVISSIVHFFHRFVILAYATRQSEVEVIRLQTANAETTNQLLKQQIQPHFLFNALNTLKSLIKKQPETAENYLIQLSDFLRASISGHRADTVSMREELKLCENYMEMQKIRFGDALIYEVQVPEDLLDHYIIPFFSLQPLLENAIKHNELTKKFPLVIQLFVEDGYIVVKNNLKVKKNVEASTGNGLSNLKERYRILFQEEILIEQNEDEFIVRLKLISNENNHH